MSTEMLKMLINKWEAEDAVLLVAYRMNKLGNKVDSCDRIQAKRRQLRNCITDVELLLSEGATEGGDKDGKADSSPMA